MESVGTMPGARSVRIMNTGVKVWWPLSCVEIVKGGTPCDPPPEASHITPEGKQTAEGAVEPKPGDVVRLVRVPSEDTVGTRCENPWSGHGKACGDQSEIEERLWSWWEQCPARDQCAS